MPQTPRINGMNTMKINQLITPTRIKNNVNKNAKKSNDKMDVFIMGNNFDPITGAVMTDRSSIINLNYNNHNDKRDSHLEILNDIKTNSNKFSITGLDFFESNKIKNVNDNLRNNLLLSSSKKVNLSKNENLS